MWCERLQLFRLEKPPQRNLTADSIDQCSTKQHSIMDRTEYERMRFTHGHHYPARSRKSKVFHPEVLSK